MSLRISSPCLLLLALAACGDGEDQRSPADPTNLIECAIGGVANFARDCEVERTRAYRTLFLTIHHPDGGFRRLEVLTDGRGVETADGAEPAQVSLAGDGIEVKVGEDRYRLPARISGDGAE